MRILPFLSLRMTQQFVLAFASVREWQPSKAADSSVIQVLRSVLVRSAIPFRSSQELASVQSGGPHAFLELPKSKGSSSAMFNRTSKLLWLTAYQENMTTYVADLPDCQSEYGYLLLIAKCRLIVGEYSLLWWANSYLLYSVVWVL